MHNVTLHLCNKDSRQLLVTNGILRPRHYLQDGAFLAKLERFGFSGSSLPQSQSTVSNPSNFVQENASDTTQNLYVWGYAQIIESNREGFDKGLGFYGWFPMTRYLVWNPDREVVSTQMRVGSENDSVVKAHTMPALDEAELFDLIDPDLYVYLRPMLDVAFALGRTLLENGFKGAQQLVITGASSKTALILAFFLKYWRSIGGFSNVPKVVGITSHRHRNHIDGLQYYDEIHTYNDISRLLQAPSLVVDLSSGPQILAMLHYHLKSQLVYVYGFGLPHATLESKPTNDAFPMGEIFNPQDFFQQVMGYDTRARMAFEFKEHCVLACEAFSSWLSPQLIDGAEEVRWVYQQILAGKSDPAVAYLCQV
ncbi:DUF2855 family protein [Sessilibacter corallicola]|uniref:DUF2855 family protein n=1 Tax=Sessilibacter corallicola TaxID=2904075 RepID=A0ABQ0AEV3_9GAMM